MPDTHRRKASDAEAERHSPRHNDQAGNQPAGDALLQGSSPYSRYSPALLSNPSLSGRGNAPVRTAAILQMQRSCGNRATQRYIQRTSSVQQKVAAPMPVQCCGGEAHEEYACAQSSPDVEKEAPVERQPVAVEIDTPAKAELPVQATLPSPPLTAIQRRARSKTAAVRDSGPSGHAKPQPNPIEGAKKVVEPILRRIENSGGKVITQAESVKSKALTKAKKESSKVLSTTTTASDKALHAANTWAGKIESLAEEAPRRALSLHRVASKSVNKAIDKMLHKVEKAGNKAIAKIEAEGDRAAKQARREGDKALDNARSEANKALDAASKFGSKGLNAASEWINAALKATEKQVSKAIKTIKVANSKALKQVRKQVSKAIITAKKQGVAASKLVRDAATSGGVKEAEDEGLEGEEGEINAEEGEGRAGEASLGFSQEQEGTNPDAAGANDITMANQTEDEAVPVQSVRLPFVPIQRVEGEKHRARVSTLHSPAIIIQRTKCRKPEARARGRSGDPIRIAKRQGQEVYKQARKWGRGAVTWARKFVDKANQKADKAVNRAYRRVDNDPCSDISGLNPSLVLRMRALKHVKVLKAAAISGARRLGDIAVHGKGWAAIKGEIGRAWTIVKEWVSKAWNFIKKIARSFLNAFFPGLKRHQKLTRQVSRKARRTLAYYKCKARELALSKRKKAIEIAKKESEKAIDKVRKAISELWPATATHKEDIFHKFAPLVYIHSEEEYGPMNPMEFIRNSELRYRTRAGKTQTVGRGNRNPKELAKRLGIWGIPYVREGKATTANTRPRGSGNWYDTTRRWSRNWYIAYRGNARGNLSRTGHGPISSPVYYDYDSKEQSITYWFFYARSVPNLNNIPDEQGAHQGDWERAVVYLHCTSKGIDLKSVKLHQHNGPPHEAQVAFSGDHPVVYSARGSHATYGQTSAALAAQGEELPDRDRTDLGRPWYTWEALRPVRAQPWYGFGGAWGDIGNLVGTTGPQGPSSYKD